MITSLSRNLFLRGLNVYLWKIGVENYSDTVIVLHVDKSNSILLNLVTI